MWGPQVHVTEELAAVEIVWDRNRMQFQRIMCIKGVGWWILTTRANSYHQVLIFKEA